MCVMLRRPKVEILGQRAIINPTRGLERACFILLLVLLSGCTYRHYAVQFCTAEDDCETIMDASKDCYIFWYCPKKIERNGMVHFATADYWDQSLTGTDVAIPIRCFKRSGDTVIEKECKSSFQ